MTYSVRMTTLRFPLLFFCLFFLFFPTSSANATQIWPARQTAVVESGTVQTVPLNVTNDGGERVLLVPEVSPFRIDGNSGAPIFDQEDSASDWIRVVPDRMLLEPGQSGTFSFAISVPEDAEVRAHYFGLFARQSSGGGTVGVGSRVGSLLFLHIAGEIREDLVRTSFSVNREPGSGGAFRARFSLENIGSIHVVPKGTISVQNMRGEEMQSFPLNAADRKVLPDDTWHGEYLIDTLTWRDIGRITISADVKYGISGKELHDARAFWYVPMWLVSSFVALAVLLAALFVGFKKRKK
jgi:hypothetical protein